MTRISILHPTARVRRSTSLPFGWREAMRSWFGQARRPQEIEYVLAVHASRWTEFWSGQLGPVVFPSWARVVVVRNEARDCNVDQLNAAAKAASGEILVGVMDDLFPPPEWDEVVLKALDVEKPQFLHVDTGSPSDDRLIVAGAMTRKLYEALGYVLWPEYLAMASDNELTEVLREAGVVVRRPDIVFEHRHPMLGKAHSDEIYDLQNAPESYVLGNRLFAERLAKGFPGAWKVKPARPTGGDAPAFTNAGSGTVMTNLA